MKKIINLIMMQYNTLFSIKKLLILVIVFSTTYSIIEPSMITFAGLMYLMVSSYTVIGYEEKSKINYMICSLPIEKKDYILSKYIYGLINIVIAIIISIVISFFSPSLPKDMSILSTIIIIAIIGIGVVSILVPIMIIIGVEKARYVLIFCMVIPICFSGNLSKHIFKYIINIDSINLAIIAILLGITLILSSYFITINLYEKKELN